MPHTLDPELRRALTARIRYYNEMGIYDFYRRALPVEVSISMRQEEVINLEHTPDPEEEMSPRKAAAAAMSVVEESIFEVMALKPEQRISDPVKALKIIRE